MRQALYMLGAGLLGIVAYTLAPGAAFAAPMSQTAQVGHTVNNSHFLLNTQGYYGDRRYYRDDEYEDDNTIDENRNVDENVDENVNDSADEGVDEDNDYPGDNREEYASPPPPPPPPPYRPYRHKPRLKKQGPSWSLDNKPVWRSDRFTPEFCYMCLGTCSEGRSCAPRCWGWRRHCQKHDF